MKITKREKVFEGYYSLHLLQIQSEVSGQTSEREQFITPDSVGVLVHDVKEDEIILVKQFRIGPEKPLLEIVAGKIEGKDQDPERTARREVLEEVGYEVDELTHWFEFYTTPGPVTECMNLFYAKVSRQIESGGGLASENEEIEIVRIKRKAFLDHPFQDAKTIMAQQKLKADSYS
ncbi:MAG: NUDIX hydrolase [Vicingaceae bacterium]